MTHERNQSVVLIHDPGQNQTFSQPEAGNHPYHMFRMIESYFLPLTCVVGLICNTLATKTFLDKKMRKFSCSMYLVTKCMSDSIFLLNMLVIYICGAFSVAITTVRILCKVVIFVTYVSGFVSVWSVIFVTVENFIRIRFPYDVKRLCTTRNATVGIAIVVLASLCLYHFSLWISDEHCQALPQFSRTTQAFVFVDTLLTLILPSILLAVFILAIISKLLGMHSSRNKQLTGSQTIPLASTVRPVGQTRKSDAQIAAVTKMLLAVSLTFFVLTVPSHAVRIIFLVDSFIQGGGKQLTRPEAIVQGIAQLFFYSSMSVNLFIFLLFGVNFRRVFKKIYSIGVSTTKEAPTIISESEKELNNCTCAESVDTTGPVSNYNTYSSKD